MDERENTLFQSSLPGPSGVRPEPPPGARRDLLRRLRALLLAGGVSFALTTWMLVRVENPASLFGWGSEPASVARAHLEALNRGELRAAYGFFSARYRQHVPFEAFHELVVTHREMFRTGEAQFTTREASGDRAVLEIRLRSADGSRYMARFTMVRAAGRWWIDDLRWALQSDSRDLVQA